MARPTEEQLSRIHRLIRDPRYTNKKHPEHPKVFAEATRAFEDAYPEPPPENDTSPGTVHVRAYTRVQDGKEIQVSQYDRTQQIAMRGLPLPNMGRRENVEDIQSNNEFHDMIQEAAAFGLRRIGALVQTNVRIKIVGDGYFWPDIVAILPDGRRMMIDVKTGEYPSFTPHQGPGYYEAMQGDNQLISADPKMELLGYKQGTFLPPFCVSVFYQRDINSPAKLVTPDECAAGLLGDPKFGGKR